MYTGASLDSDEAQDSREPNATLSLPKYCRYYKFFLVEELVLESDYRQLHYGMCSLIGKIREHADGYFELENIRLPHLHREYALPEGTLAIRLLFDKYHGDKLRHGRYCEVCGEVKLLNEHKHAATLTSFEVHLQVERLKTWNNVTQGDQFLRQLHDTYKPVIYLDHLHEIDRAAELAERNFEIRMLLNHQ